MTTKITLIKMRAVLAVGALLLSSGRVSAGDNPNFRLPLHATLDLGGTCSTTINCFTQLPTINVLPQREVEIYLLVFNANRLSGVQTAFEWDRALGWTFLSGQWDCRPGQITSHEPQDPGGPDAGLLTTSFDCVLGPQVAVIGKMRFLSGGAGGSCLGQVEPSPPRSIQAVDCSLGIDHISSSVYLGKICVVFGGSDGCGVLPTTREATTWGQIKATY